MLNKTRYWAFEGNEGTGKTVLSKAFADSCGIFWTYEPNAETEELKILRELALDKTKSITKYAREMCLLANRNIHHSQHINPILGGEEAIVTDRSILSGMVYASIETFSFKEWMNLINEVQITTFPDVFIYCTASSRKIDKNKKGRDNDIYDNADNYILEKIDHLYEDALIFLKEHKLTKDIPIIRFENNFNKSIEDNLTILLNILKSKL